MIIAFNLTTIVIAVAWISCAIWAANIADRRGLNFVEWLGLGIVGGPFTLLVVLFAKPR